MCVVTLWTLAARSRAELDDSSSGESSGVAVRQLGLPCGNRTASSYWNGSRHSDRDHQVMISEMPVGVNENLLESRDYFFLTSSGFPLPHTSTLWQLWGADLIAIL